MRIITSGDTKLRSMAGSMIPCPFLKRDYLPDDLESELKGAGVSGTVVVQARQSLEETRWLLDLAETYTLLRVWWAGSILRSPDMDKQLEEFASHPMLVGVRHVIHDEPDDDFMLQPGVSGNGIALLGSHDSCL